MVVGFIEWQPQSRRLLGMVLFPGKTRTLLSQERPAQAIKAAVFLYPTRPLAHRLSWVFLAIGKQSSNQPTRTG